MSLLLLLSCSLIPLTASPMRASNAVKVSLSGLMHRARFFFPKALSSAPSLPWRFCEVQSPQDATVASL